MHMKVLDKRCHFWSLLTFREKPIWSLGGGVWGGVGGYVVVGYRVGGGCRVEGGVSGKFPRNFPEIPEGSLCKNWYCDTRTKNFLKRPSRDEFYDHTGFTCWISRKCQKWSKLTSFTYTPFIYQYHWNHWYGQPMHRSKPNAETKRVETGQSG